MDLLVVGAGDVGRWFARTVDASVAFADTDESAADAAAQACGGTVADLDGNDRFDVVCVAVPMRVVDSVITAQGGRATEALVDVTGVMGPAVTAMQEVAPEKERLSLHPLFAPERSPGSIAAVQEAPGPTTERIRSALEAAGNSITETTADEHDEAMETVQAATHAAILSFAIAADSVPAELSTPTFEDLSALADRVAAGTPRVYADIQATYDGAEAVADAADAIATAENEELVSLLADAAAGWRGEGE